MMLILQGGEIRTEDTGWRINKEKLVFTGENVGIPYPTGQAIRGPTLHDKLSAARIVLAKTQEIELRILRTTPVAGIFALVLPIEKCGSNAGTLPDAALHPRGEMVGGLQTFRGRQTYATPRNNKARVSGKTELVVASNSKLHCGRTGNLQRHRQLRRDRVDIKLAGRVEPHAPDEVQTIAEKP